MRLSRRARYALRMMVEITRQSNDGSKVSLANVSKRTRISRRYLEQLAIGLKNASLIMGMSGRSGGYLLARPAEKIKVGEIIEAAIGPVNIVECVDHPDLCIQVDFCPCRRIYQRINQGINKVMNEHSLAELSDMKKDCEIPDKYKPTSGSCPVR